MLFTIRNVAAALIITLLLAGAAQAWATAVTAGATGIPTRAAAAELTAAAPKKTAGAEHEAWLPLSDYVTQPSHSAFRAW